MLFLFGITDASNSLQYTVMELIDLKTRCCMKKIALLLTGLVAGSALFPTAALANTIARDLQNRVIVTGLDEYADYQFSSPDTYPTRSASASACGVVRVAPTDNYPILPSHSLGINGTSYQVQDLPVLPTPSCKASTLSNLAALTSDAWRDSNGNVYVKGLTAYNPYTVEYTSLESTRKVTANACGHVSIALSATGTASLTRILSNGSFGSSINIEGSQYEPTLAVPICSKGIGYLPESLMGGSGTTS